MKPLLLVILTPSHLGDCKLGFYRACYCLVQSYQIIFQIWKPVLCCSTLFFLSWPFFFWGSQKVLNLFLRTLWIRFVFTIRSKNTECLSLCDVNSLNLVGNIRGSHILSSWFVWVFLPFYWIALSREYYLCDIILIRFLFIKWKECVRQSVLKTSGIWIVIESIPSQLIYVLWWERSVVQFVQKWRMFTLWNHTREVLWRKNCCKRGSWAPFCLISLVKEDEINVLQ